MDNIKNLRYIFSLFVLIFLPVFFFGVKEADAKACGNIISGGVHIPYANYGGGASAPPPPPPDQCRNISGYQYPVPSGFYKENWQCYLKTEFYVACRAIPNPVKPGDRFNFIATPFYHTGDVTFTWHQGSGSGGSLLYRDTTDGVSAYGTSFTAEGNQQVTVVGVDDAGHRQERVCGISVRADADEVDTSAGDDGVDSAKIEFDLEEGLTNDTCTAEWKVENVAQCFIVNTQGTINEPITTDREGSKEVGPGTWFLRCISQSLNPDGSAKILQSQEEICRLNLDLRER